MELLLLSRWLTPVVDFVGERPARLAFVATASAIYPDPAWVELDRRTLIEQGHTLIETDVATLSPTELRSRLAEVDAVFISGGNTFHLLGALRRSGNDAVLVDAVRAGLPYIGVSAGAVVVGPDIEPIAAMDDPAETEPLDSTRGLGLTAEVVVPHADGIVCGVAVIEQIRATYAAGFPLVFLTDDQGLLVSDGIHRVIDA